MNLRTKKRGEAVYKLFRRHEDVVQEILRMKRGNIKEMAKRLNTKQITILIIVGGLKQAGIIREVRIR